MSKNIIICSDGTGNTANKNRGSNVFKVFEAVDVNKHKWEDIKQEDKANKPQVAIYDDGVGTQSFKPFKILGGAFGWGLSRNVYDHEKKDDIYVFGFSRGAFTVRTLVGFIAECGLPRHDKCENEKEFDDLVESAYNNYRKRDQTILQFILNWIFSKPMDENKFHKGIPIKFVGVWDTVSAVGLPFYEFTQFWNRWVWRFTFHDKRLYSKVEKACHALSLDDERKTFHPLIWDEKGESPGRIEQVWFSGVHSNVGGGYPKQGMSLVPLHWMMSKAHMKSQGVRFLNMDWDNYRDHRNVCGKLYNSRAGLAVYYRYKPRELDEIFEEQKEEHKIHISVFERIAQGTEGYSPGNLPRKFKVVSDKENWDDQNKISKTIAERPKKDEELIDQIRLHVRARKIAYGLFLVCSLTAVVIYFYGEFSNNSLGEVFGNLSLWNTPIGILKIIFPDQWWLAIGLLIAFFLSLIARWRMESICSTFWHSILPSLKKPIEKCWSELKQLP